LVLEKPAKPEDEEENEDEREGFDRFLKHAQATGWSAPVQ
jgi:hypothetical protein